MFLRPNVFVFLWHFRHKVLPLDTVKESSGNTDFGFIWSTWRGLFRDRVHPQFTHLCPSLSKTNCLQVRYLDVLYCTVSVVFPNDSIRTRLMA